MPIFDSNLIYELTVKVEIRKAVDPLALGVLGEIESSCHAVKITIDQSETSLTFAWLIHEALQLFTIMHLDVEIVAVLGIQHEGVFGDTSMLHEDLLVVDYCSQVVLCHGTQAKLTFELICGGPIYNCDDSTLLLIAEFFGKEARQLANMRKLCTRFARVFSSCEVWDMAQQELEQEFIRWSGLDVGVSNEMVSTGQWLRKESILPRLSAARVRWISLKSSRLAIYLGSIPVPGMTLKSLWQVGTQWLLDPEASQLPPRQRLRNCVIVAGKPEVSTLVHETMALLLPDSSIAGQHHRGAIMAGHTEVSRTASYRCSPRHEMPNDRMTEYNAVAPSERTRMVQRFGYSTLGDDRLVFVRQQQDSHDPILTRPRTLGLILTLECRLNIDMVMDGVPVARDFDKKRDISLIQRALLDLPETALQEEKLREELTRLWDCYATSKLQTLHAHTGYAATGLYAQVEMLHDSALLATSEVARPLLLLLCITDMGQRQAYRCWGDNDTNADGVGVGGLHGQHEPTVELTPTPIPTKTNMKASGITDDEFLEVCKAAWSRELTRQEMVKMAVENEQRVRRQQHQLAQEICASYWVRRVRGLLVDLIKAARDPSEHSRRWHIQAVNSQALDTLGFMAKPLASTTKETLAKSGIICGVNAFIRAISANNTREAV